MTFLTKEKYSSDNKAVILENNFHEFMKKVRYRLPIFTFISRQYKLQGTVLEIGVGSAWLSASLSKITDINKVYALDISQDILNKIGEKVIIELNGNKEKIDFIIKEMNRVLKDNGF